MNLPAVVHFHLPTSEREEEEGKNRRKGEEEEEEEEAKVELEIEDRSLLSLIRYIHRKPTHTNFECTRLMRAGEMNNNLLFLSPQAAIISVL